MKVVPSKILPGIIPMVAFVTIAYADSVMNHDPGPYKMTKFGNSSEVIPLNGPVIHVYSKNGQSYTTVSNDNENLHHTSSVGGNKSREYWMHKGFVVKYENAYPVAVRYTGSIYASKPGTQVTYQISGTDWDSPERTITFAAAGSREITGWTQRYREKESNPGQISAAPADTRKTPDASGTAQLKVKYNGGSTQSAAIPYTVFCNAEKPGNVTLKVAE